MAAPTIDLYDFTRPRLAELIASWGIAPNHAKRLWTYLYRQGIDQPDAMHDLPVRLRTRLSGEARAAAVWPQIETQSDNGLTCKYLLGLADGSRIETVLMRYDRRVTACLSSQAGCALGCVFCATGQMGFTRNLSAGEIVAQALHVAAALRRGRESLRNIVLMGMGEPLLNYDAVVDAVEILCDQAGLSIGAKRVTLSTVGVVPGIVRLADEGRPFSLAVSLHAATQEQRVLLIPAARAWPLDALMEACRYYAAKLDRKIFFEWTLIEGRNDSPGQAHALAHLVAGIPAQINIIPLNRTTRFSAEPAADESVQRFRSILEEHSIPSSVRQRRGIDIAAGCGQLAAAHAG